MLPRSPIQAVSIPALAPDASRDAAPTRPLVAVVGGGMAGLLAALRLEELGAAPVVFEAAASMGGMIETVAHDGWLFELGAATITSSGGAAAPILSRLVDAAEVIRPAEMAQRRFLVHRGRPEVVPVTAAQLIATPLLSVAGRMRLLREPFIARRPDDGEESVSAFARRRFGDEVASVFFEPLLAGTTGGDPEQLLARHALPYLVAHERRAGSVLKGRLRAAREARRLGQPRSAAGPWTLRGGLAALTGMLSQPLEGRIHAAAAVAAIDFAATRPVVELANGEQHPVDAVVMAVPAPVLGRLALRGGAQLNLAPVASMPHASLVVVGLGYRRAAIAHPLDGGGLLAATSERRQCLAMQFGSSQFADRAPSGHVGLTVTLGGARHPAMASSDDGELVEVAHQEVVALLGATERPVVQHVRRWPRALPLAVAGHGERLAAADQAEAAEARLVFTGAWRDGLSIGEVMAGGVAAAERLMTRLGWRTDIKETVE